jgi:predicted regulator of Ras-like GTPase activity (Roadblock/LC7/MglB family)
LFFADYVSISNVSISTVGDYSIGVYGQHSRYWSLSNVNITTSGSNSWGVYAATSAGWLLENGTISTSGATGYGVSTSVSSSWIVANANISTVGASARAITTTSTSNDWAIRGVNASTLGSTAQALYIGTAADGWLVEDSWFSSALSFDVEMRLGSADRRASFVNTSFDSGSVSFPLDTSGWLDRGWWVRVFVNDSSGLALEDAAVFWEDSGAFVGNPTAWGYNRTMIDGFTSFVLYEYSSNRTHSFSYSNYSLYADAAGHYPSDSISLNVTDNVDDLFFTLLDGYFPVCVVETGYCFGTIQQAIDNASSGMTVMITDNATYTDNVLINKSLILSHNSTIGSPTILSSNTAVTITSSNVRLHCNGMTIRYSYSYEGYGILIWSELAKVENVDISDCNIIKDSAGGSSSSYRPAILGYGRSTAPVGTHPNSVGTLYYVDYVNISNVNVTVTGPYSRGVHGVYSRYWNVSGLIVTTSDDYSHGIYGLSSSSWSVSDVNITTYGSSAYGIYGEWLSTSWLLSRINISTSGVSARGLQVQNTDGWIVQDSIVRSLSSYDVYLRLDNSARRVGLINTSYDSSSVYFYDASAGWLDVGYWVSGYVNDSDGVPLGNASIFYSDSGLLSSNPSGLGYSVTGSDGYTDRFALYAYSRNQTHTFGNNNYSLYADASGYYPSEIVNLNVSDNDDGLFFTLIEGKNPVCVVETGYCFGTIQQAIDNASSGMTVMITDNATYTDNVLINKSLILSHNSTIGSPTILSSNTAVTITSSNVRLHCNGMTIRYSYSYEGYGILIWSELAKVENVDISDCNIIKDSAGGSSSSYRPAILGYGLSITPVGTLPNSGGTLYYVEYVNISNVNITVAGQYSRGIHGVHARNWNVSGLRVLTSGDDSHGVSGVTSSSWSMTDVNITTYGSSAYGVYGYYATSWILSRLNISTADAEGVYVRTSDGWIISDSIINAATGEDVYVRLDNPSWRVKLVNTSHNASNVVFHDENSGWLDIGYWVTGYANYTSGLPLSDANVSWADAGTLSSNPSKIGFNLTGSSGLTDRIPIYVISSNQTHNYTHNNYTFNASRDNVSISLSYNITDNVQLNFSLDVPLDCGVISRSGTYVLDRNVSAAGTCFTINVSDVSLDCQGHTINYSTTDEGYGILIWSESALVENVNISNCNIVKDSAGGSSSSRRPAILGYGRSILLSGGTVYKVDHVSISNVTISTAGEHSRGIHGDQSGYWNISNVSISTSGSNSWGLYGLTSPSWSLSDVHIATSGGSAFGISGQTSSWSLTDVHITTTGSNAHGVYGYYSSSWSLSSLNITTSSTDARGIYIVSSDGWIVTDSVINTSVSSDVYLRMNNDTFRIALINTSYNASSISYYDENAGWLDYGWWVDAYVNNTLGNPISGANVSWEDAGLLAANPSVAGWNMTGGDGFTGRFVIYEYSQNQTHTFEHNNYTFNASSGRAFEGLFYNVSDNAVLSFTLDDPTPLYSKFDGSTTNFSDSDIVPDLSSVSQPILEISSYGRIRWHDYLDVSSLDYDSFVHVENRSISVSVPDLRADHDSPANISFYDTGFENVPALYKDGLACGPPDCNLTGFSNGFVNFSVSGFSNYTLGLNSQLEIWDGTDLKGGSNSYSINVIMPFYANYSNVSDNSPISGAGNSCEISFDTGSGYGSFAAMDYNATSGLYEFNRSFSNSGFFGYNVSCMSTNGFENLSLSGVFDYGISFIDSCMVISSPGSYAMNQSVVSSGTCFTVNVSGVALDCRGHTINYSTADEGYGILIWSQSSLVQGVNISNCNIVKSVSGGATGSRRPAILGYGRSEVPSGSISTSLGTLFYADYVSISNVSISTVGDYSIGVYGQHSRYWSLSNVNITTSGSNSWGVYAATSAGWLLENGTISTSGATGYGVSTSGSSSWIVANANISTVGASARAITTTSTSNAWAIRGVNASTLGSTAQALYIGTAADGWLVEDSHISSALSFDVEMRLGSAARRASFVNTSFDSSSVSFPLDTSGWLDMGWWVRGFVNDSLGVPLDDAFVVSEDSGLYAHNPSAYGLSFTGLDGYTASFVVYESSFNRTHSFNHNNYSLTADKTGYSPSIVSLNVYDNMDVFFSLDSGLESVCVVETGYCFLTIQEAVDNASSGMTVMIVDNKTYVESVTINKPLLLSHNSTVGSPSVWSAGTAFSIVSSDVGLDCNGMTIRYSNSDEGYGILIWSQSATVQNVNISNCNIVKSVTGGATGSRRPAILGYGRSGVPSGSISTSLGTLFFADYVSISNVSISTVGDYSIGVYGQNSRSWSLSNVNITTSGSNSWGVYAASSFGWIISGMGINTTGGTGHGVSTSICINWRIYDANVSTSGASARGITTTSISQNWLLKNTNIITQGSSAQALYIGTDADYWLVEDSNLYSTLSAGVEMRLGYAGRRAAFVNTSFNNPSFPLATSGWIDRGWWVTGYVNDSEGAFVSGAGVIWEDSGGFSNNPTSSGSRNTMHDGYSRFALYSYSANQTHTLPHSNYSLYADKAGYEASEPQSLNLTGNTDIFFTLNATGIKPVCVVETGNCFLTIQEAVDNASSGMTVMITDDSYYYESISIDKPLVLSHNSTSGSPIIAAGATALSVTSSNVSIECNGMTIYYSESDLEGYGILLWSKFENVNNVSIHDCSIVKNTGGGIYWDSLRPAIFGWGFSEDPRSDYTFSGTILNVDDVTITNTYIATKGEGSFGIYGYAANDWMIQNVNMSVQLVFAVGGSNIDRWNISMMNVSIGFYFGGIIDVKDGHNWSVSNIQSYSSALGYTGVLLTSSDNWHISELDITGVDFGILAWANNLRVEDTNISSNGRSIYIYLGSNATFSRINASSTSSYSIDLDRYDGAVFINSTFVNGAANGVYLNGAGNTVFINSYIRSQGNDIRVNLGGRHAYFINTTYETAHYVTNSGYVHKGWWVDYYANNTVSSPVSGANVSWNDAGTVAVNPTASGWSVTGADGFSRSNALYEYSENQAGRYYHTNYTFNVSADGYDGLLYESRNFTGNTELAFTLESIDQYPPTWSNPSDNSTDDAPKINENIQMNITLHDDYDLFGYIFSWNGTGSWQNDSMQLIGGTEHTLSVIKQVGLPRDSTIGWKVYFNDSTGKENISDIFTFTVKNTPPDTPILSYPHNDSNIYDRAPLFNWTGYDADSDALTYNLSIYCMGGCSADNRHYNYITDNEFQLTEELQFLYDDGYYYLWSVNACDYEECSEFSENFTFTLSSLVSITFTQNNSDFGLMQLGQTNSTEDNSPNPLVLQNDGNVKVNVSFYAQTPLFERAALPSPSFQARIREAIGNYSMETDNNWFEIDDYLTPAHVLRRLNYTIGYNQAMLDLMVTVPLDEPGNDKTAMITAMAVMS